MLKNINRDKNRHTQIKQVKILKSKIQFKQNGM